MTRKEGLRGLNTVLPKPDYVDMVNDWISRRGGNPKQDGNLHLFGPQAWVLTVDVKGQHIGEGKGNSPQEAYEAFYKAHLA